MSEKTSTNFLELIKREKVVFWLSMAFMLILPFSSSNIGFSSDELNQWDYGRGALKYYMSFGEDTSSYKNYNRYDEMFRDEGMINYGALFFMTYSAACKLFPDIPPYDVRHFLTALVGLVCVLFTGLITKEISSSWRPAIFAIWLLFLTPFFVGHSLVNDKDIPYAAAMAMGIYFIIRLIKEIPDFRYTSLLGFAIATGLAIGVRLGGLLLVPYLFLFIGVAYLMDEQLRRKYIKHNRKPLYKNIGWMILISIAGFYFGVFWYPYIISGPIIERTIQVFNDISDHYLNVLQVFEGELLNSNEFPWYYHAKYILITVPVVITLLFLSFLPVYFVTAKQKIKPVYVFILLFATLFPLAYIIYTDANVYGRWRHILFIYPTFVSAAGLSFHHLLSYFRKTYIWYGIAALVGLSLLKPAIWMVRNHPYEYIFTNVLVGWYENSYTDYPGDTYRLATLDSYKWLKKHVERNEQNFPVKVVSNDGFVLRYLTRNERDTLDASRSGYKALCFKEWDYAIMSMIFLKPELREKMYPPPKTIYTVDVDNVPISAVIKRPTQSKLGYEAFQNQNYSKALQHFKKAYEKRPDNMCNWFYLGNIYLQAGQYQKSINFLNQFKNYFPSNFRANGLLAQAHFRKGNYQQASQLFYFLLQNDVEFIQKFKLNYLIGQCFYEMNNYQKAARFVNRSIQQNSDYQRAQQLQNKLRKQGY